MNTRMSLHEGDGDRRIGAAEDIKYGAGFTHDQLAAAEQMTAGLELSLEGDDVAAARAQAKADIAPSAETLTFAPEQLATAEAVMRGEVTPQIIKEAPTRAELDLMMDERLQAQLMSAEIKGDVEGIKKAEDMLELHRQRVADAAEAKRAAEAKNAPAPAPEPIL